MDRETYGEISDHLLNLTLCLTLSHLTRNGENVLHQLYFILYLSVLGYYKKIVSQCSVLDENYDLCMLDESCIFNVPISLQKKQSFSIH